MSAPAGEAMLKRLDELRAALPDRRRIWIVPHDYPDPDALASAAAFHLLLAHRYGLHSQIVFSGDVSRAENKEVLRRLRVRWHRMDELRTPRRNVPCLFVDTAPWCANVTTPPYARAVAVIDHHRHVLRHAGRGLYTDIRAGAGATTTIAYEYLKAAGVPLPRWLAAVMLYAVASETMDLSHGSERGDEDCFTELAARADLRIAGRIRHAPLPRAYYGHLQEAITSACLKDRLAWSHLRRVEQPEIVAEVADFLLRMQGLRWSFCTAHLNGGLYVSLRSSQRGARCAHILRAAVGRHGSAGGHHRMAAGYLHMERLTPEEREERRVQLVRNLLRRILRRSGPDPDQPELGAEPLVEARLPHGAPLMAAPE